MACERDSEFRVDWKEEGSIHNLITRLNLICESKFNIGLIGSNFFLGILLAVAFIAPLGDIIGRRPLLIGSGVLQFFSYYFIVFKADKLELLWAGFLFLGLAGGT